MNLLPLVTLSAGVLALAGLAALALPRTAHVERSALISSPPDVLRALVSSTAGFQAFNPFRAEDPALEIRVTGPASGVGAGFSWKGSAGEGTQTIVVDEPGRVAMQLDLGAMGRPLQTFTLEPAGGATRVVWALDADLGFNPLARVAGLFIDRMLGHTYERGLRLLEQQARPPQSALAGR